MAENGSAASKILKIVNSLKIMKSHNNQVPAENLRPLMVYTYYDFSIIKLHDYLYSRKFTINIMTDLKKI